MNGNRDGLCRVSSKLSKSNTLGGTEQDTKQTIPKNLRFIAIYAITHSSRNGAGLRRRFFLPNGIIDAAIYSTSPRVYMHRGARMHDQSAVPSLSPPIHNSISDVRLDSNSF